MNAAADAEDTTLRLSMDAKAMVKIGPFARGGKNRVLTKAVDHDARGRSHCDTSGYFPSRLG